ncbi:hypothetical protein ACLIJR_03875 [Hydrogenophaga sp. XSHU_21]
MYDIPEQILARPRKQQSQLAHRQLYPQQEGLTAPSVRLVLTEAIVIVEMQLSSANVLPHLIETVFNHTSYWRRPLLAESTMLAEAGLGPQESFSEPNAVATINDYTPSKA